MSSYVCVALPHGLMCVSVRPAVSSQKTQGECLGGWVSLLLSIIPLKLEGSGDSGWSCVRLP